MNKFLELRTERKVIFFIGVAKRCLTLINDSKQACIAADALECCWKQLITKKYDGEILYDYLDNEENGLTVFSEMTDDVKEVFALNCIIDAVAFASKFAFDSHENALKVSTRLFCDKWSDFCYPSDYLIIDCGDRALLYYEDMIYYLDKIENT